MSTENRVIMPPDEALPEAFKRLRIDADREVAQPLEFVALWKNANESDVFSHLFIDPAVLNQYRNDTGSTCRFVLYKACFWGSGGVPAPMAVGVYMLTVDGRPIYLTDEQRFGIDFNNQVRPDDPTWPRAQMCSLAGRFQVTPEGKLTTSN